MIDFLVFLALNNVKLAQAMCIDRQTKVVLPHENVFLPFIEYLYKRL